MANLSNHSHVQQPRRATRQVLDSKCIFVTRIDKQGIKPQTCQQMIQKHLQDAISKAKMISEGEQASYIPELAAVDPELLGVVVETVDGQQFIEAREPDVKITLQSCAKVVLFIGMLETFGTDQVLEWTKVEPSGTAFASVARLDQFGPLPSNPMLNSGAINLCSHIPGNHEAKLAWIDHWMTQCFGTSLSCNNRVFASERRTGDRNRSLAYLLRSTEQLVGDVEEILETYFSLCAYELTLQQAVALPGMLARLGKNIHGEAIISTTTAQQTLAVMATCGLYNESGTHLIRTGLPAKSSVSGLIMAVSPNRAGIVTLSPKVNPKGTSLRGEAMLIHLAAQCNWHFATG